MDYFAIGKDKSLKDIKQLALPLSGGTLTGNIRYNDGKETYDTLRFIPGTEYGVGVVVCGGGSTVIGGGESGYTLQPATGSGDAEQLILANDYDIDFYVNCQNGLENAKKVTLSRSTGLLSGHQKKINMGTAAPTGGSDGDIYIQY